MTRKVFDDCAAEIRAYERKAEKFEKKGDEVVKRYMDERKNNDSSGARLNILWSNVQTLKPAIYANDPIPRVERRFRQKDEVSRIGATILERGLSYSIECTDFGRIMDQVVLDRLLPGRGTAWVRYVPTFERSEKETADEDTGQISEDVDERLVYEEAVPDYVHWKDFGHSVARTWEEVTKVWRRTYLDKDELTQRFGKKLADRIPMDYEPEDYTDEKTSEQNKKATIYELWDKRRKLAIWLHKEMDDTLDERKDPLKLKGFFPCPKPLLATISNDTLIPVADYCEYQDQAQELDALTERITMITSAVKVAGVFDASAPGIGRLLTEGIENQLIPVDSWAALAEKGGLKGVMQLLPIGEIAEVLGRLYDARDRVKQDLYEVTGIADIIRGSSAPQETATAQGIKSRFATLRLSSLQRQVQEFARDLLRIMGDLQASKFARQTLSLISGTQLLTMEEKQQLQVAQQRYQQMAQQHQQLAAQAQQIGQPPPPAPPPPPSDPRMNLPTWEEVERFLRNDEIRAFSIEIETDSTIATNDEFEKKSAGEFVAAIGQFSQAVTGAVQAGIITADAARKTIQAAMRRFRFSREVEDAIDEQAGPNAAQQAQQQAQQQAMQAMQKAQLDEQQAKTAEQQEKARKAKADATDAERQIDKTKAEITEIEQRTMRAGQPDSVEEALAQRLAQPQGPM